MIVDHPIHYAAMQGDRATVQRWIQKMKQLKQGAFNIAVCRGHMEIVENLIDDDVEIEEDDAIGNNALSYSIMGGNVEILKMFIERKVNVNKPSGWSPTVPLISAAIFGRVGVVKLLASHKDIDLNARNSYGHTALWTAANSGYEKMLGLLLAAGVDLSIADDKGQTPLDRAKANGHDGCIQLLEGTLTARFLRHVRAINVAYDAIIKAANEAEGMDEEEKKQKMITVAPAYLKGRVERDEELPQVELMMHEEEKVAAVLEHMMDGQFPTDMFERVMEMMLPQWDDTEEED